MPTFDHLAISDLDRFVFGSAPRPLVLGDGLIIGGGDVYPELNFTLPPMTISAETMPDARAQYKEMIGDAVSRAVTLHAPGLVVEFELLPELTSTPEWGAEITAILRQALDTTAREHGLRSALRVTPNDVREFTRPPVMRHGPRWDEMMRSFDLCAAAGADLLSIESTGGKEVHDEAILGGDLMLSAFALGVLGSRDMTYLWDHIIEIARRHDVIASGDSACGFANTAMVLAEQRYVPRVWAAVIRVMSVPRSLVAFERGAVGPGKDCAYEGVYLKAITGYPMSLEGAEAACAHPSPIGNVARAVADLWGNESVQNVKLLGGMAPTVSLEQLVYATRTMNEATARGPEAVRLLRDLWSDSDRRHDPQAYVLRPDVALDLAGRIVEEDTPYRRMRRAAREALAALRRGYQEGAFALSAGEVHWLDRLSRQAEALPDDEDAFIDRVAGQLDPARVRLGEYGIGVAATR
jgi:methanol--5-hydroxybenzimidazolylcobamide Co-methyltransferase